jgi:tetratricopeptide (TPR) repeat protein
MNPLSWLKNIAQGTPDSRMGYPDSTEGHAPPSQDTLAAIGELSRVVRNNPDAVETYLALGNLFRSQGEIERAVHIRNNLIVRPGLAPELKAKAWFELGRDFKRAGLFDRAMSAFEEARKLAGADAMIMGEQARLAADSGDFERAARIYARLGQPLPQAHYLVMEGRRRQARGLASDGGKFLKQALKVYPGSVEAWIEFLVRAFRKQDHAKLKKTLAEALEKVPRELRFLLLDELWRHAGPPDEPLAEEDALCEIDGPLSVVAQVLEEQEADVLLHYYTALIYLRCQNTREAGYQLEKSLVLGPEFWPARLELLALAADEQHLTPVFENQMRFFLERARTVKRFACRKCGLKSATSFFVCPRCQSWHSIAFRMQLTE